MSDIYTMGIDIGSTSSKCVILKNGKEVISEGVVNLGAGTKGADQVIDEVLKKANLTYEDIDVIVSTGYGRNSYEGARKTMSELSCHARGGAFIFGDVRTIIDIGGQDIKVLKLSSKGQLTNFLMNDKCAAGTGRFLEVMAGVLDVKLEDMGDLDKEATEKTPISSTCTVFAESEVISCMAKKIPIPNILRGIHASVATRVAGLAKRGGLTQPVAMTGGVTKNSGIVRALGEELETEIKISPDSQMAGAIGAALYAYDEYLKG
ncbi:acyl-CoA dehydratase activase [Peptostreptococcus canis]|uniref:2-hydroxyglutaryl-CoA dehydratase n=1 Tax=Peptostreptococcus canis TaxID=1159213 RepID=A0ABR6TJI5_9FIRM|nr:acyl-CoA dehydratase activase [Peptostreptococcus canis]MBC2575470.1 2-hydroxyglutaryl-CoA dehydratase [Peptostreptococcus canis]MBP1997338.1 putative CoA-substrate-specific enzyme activase [Peptostreptococcus canis]